MANGRQGRKLKAAARRQQRSAAAPAAVVVGEPLDDADAMRLAAEHLSKLDPSALVKHKADPGRVVAKPTHPNAIVCDAARCHATPFKEFVVDLKRRAQTDPATVRMLLDAAKAPQLACACGLGARCHARALDHFARQAAALETLVAGMRLADCAWWTSDDDGAPAAAPAAPDALMFEEGHFMCVCRACGR